MDTDSHKNRKKKKKKTRNFTIHPIALEYSSKNGKKERKLFTCYLNSSCIRKSIKLMFMSSSRNKFTLLYQTR